MKSLFRYDTPLARIGVHGPILNGNEQDVTVCLGDSVNVNTEETLHGVEVLGLSPNTTASTTDKPNQAWVMHRANRSEIEYSASLFRPHANDDPSQVSLKSNRYGWEDKCHHDPTTTAICSSIMKGDERLKFTTNHLSTFIRNCQIEEGLIREHAAHSAKRQSPTAFNPWMHHCSSAIKLLPCKLFKAHASFKTIQERLNFIRTANTSTNHSGN